MSDGLIVFISEDRGFFVAVDSRDTATADPDALRARAKAALTQIYGSRPATIDALEQTDVPWQAGVRFATAKGSEGTAIYTVDGPAGHQWTYGLIYGYKTQGSQQLRETLYQTIAKLQLNPPSAGSANAAEGLPTKVQQPILDAAWAKLKPQYPKDALLIGLIGTEGEYAAALATPAGQRPLFVYLQRHAGMWAVVEASSIPSSEILRQKGIPESLIQASDAYFVIDQTSGRVQDPRAGLNGYISAPRIADGFARLFVVPADSEQRDAVTMLFKREGTAWTWLSAGMVFPEDDLVKLGVPESLWPYGDSVQGPA